jgi:hypothetical protein
MSTELTTLATGILHPPALFHSRPTGRAGRTIFLYFLIVGILTAPELAPGNPEAATTSTDKTDAPEQGPSVNEAEEPASMGSFFDEEDGMLDFSAWLLTAKGFLPTGTLITEPAIGNGGALGLMFLHDSIKNRMELAAERNPDGTLKRLPPPSVTGLFGFGTENGSWGAGLAHMHVFKEDRMRYLGLLFYNEMNLDFYGQGGDLPGPIESFSYSLDGYILLQQMTYRLGDSDYFLGANYRYMAFDAQLDPPIAPPPGFPSLNQTITSAGIGLIAEYDSRNTMFTPDKGVNIQVIDTIYNEAVGSDRDFNILNANLRGWIPVRPSWVLGLRGDGAFSGGDIPFYMLPRINQRGISMSRYQGQHTLSTEAELRWDFTPRWSLIGFAGMGWVAQDSLDDFDLSDGHVAGGTGFRYLISRIFGIRTGMDFAWSEEDFAFYFTTGTAWGQK